MQRGTAEEDQWVAPWVTAVKSWRWGTGYLSSSDPVESVESPHGRQFPGVRFGTICTGEDQLLICEYVWTQVDL